MGNKIWGFESKRERNLFLGIVGVLILVAGMVFYPGLKTHINEKIDGNTIIQKELKAQEMQLSKKEYYDMFQCSCCGRSIDAGCCGMAKQRKEHVDKLLLDGLEGNEVVYEMVKKFGFDVLMDQSREQEIRDYIISKASKNPPKIEIEPATYNFGTISQADGIVTTTFTVKNTGKSELVIENIDSSCMCTTARLVYKGEESPEFGMSMHGDNPENFELRILPGESAQLNVYYDPMAHGKQKKPELKITREVTVISNDPVDFQKKARIRITQVY